MSVPPLMPELHVVEWDDGHRHNEWSTSSISMEYIFYFGFGNGVFNSMRDPNGCGDGAPEYYHMKGQT